MFVIVGVIDAAIGAGTSNNAAAAQPTAPALQAQNSAAAPAPATTQAATPAQMTFSCTGNAPNGIDITYGTDSSITSASSLPLKETEPLDTSAKYLDVNAQLSGSGTVTCTTVVHTSDGTQTVSSATANGDFTIANAEVCSTFDGGWEKC